MKSDEILVNGITRSWCISNPTWIQAVKESKVVVNLPKLNWQKGFR